MSERQRGRERETNRQREKKRGREGATIRCRGKATASDNRSTVYHFIGVN